MLDAALSRRPRASASPRLGTSAPSRLSLRGLLLGGVALGGLGAWVGASLRESCPTEAGAQCGRDRLGDAVALGATGAVIGGTLGYLVGRFSGKPEIAFAGGTAP